MTSLNQILPILKQLKKNPDYYNLTLQNIESIDRAILEIENYSEGITGKSLEKGILTLKIVKLILELFYNGY